jgi:hypothetical protein
MKTLTLLLFFSLPSLAQTLSVVDDSPSDSPITVRGTITFDPNNPANVTCDLTGHNSASQIVVAWRQDISVSPNGTMYSHRHDDFFKDQSMWTAMSLQPTSDYSADDIDCSFFSVPTGQSANPPGIHVTTRWAQFIDGSTWGDAQVTADVMRERIDALAYLRALKAAYTTGGSEALVEALQQNQPTQTADNPKLRRLVLETEGTLRYLLAESGLQAVQDRIESSLARAEVHKRWLQTDH